MPLTVVKEMIHQLVNFLSTYPPAECACQHNGKILFCLLQCFQLIDIHRNHHTTSAINFDKAFLLQNGILMPIVSASARTLGS